MNLRQISVIALAIIAGAILALLQGCASTEPETIIETEEVGCTSDAECNDGRFETDDWCDILSGACNHIEYRERICESFTDCDDDDPASVDACEDGVCQHTREVDAPFDPSAPERQDAILICETDYDLRWTEFDEPVAYLAFEGCSAPELWHEDGYRMTIVVRGLETGETARLHVAPQLRVGEPGDRYRVTVSRYESATDFYPTVVIAGEYSVPEIEEGFEIAVTEGTNAPVVGGTHVILRLWPLDDVRSRTIQWALPVDGVTRIDEGPAIHTVPASSWFVRIPRHGFLTLREGPSGEMQCTGTVRALDVQTDEWIPGGFVREEGDPEVYHLSDLRSPRLLQSFQGTIGGIDWLDQWATACASVLVLPSGSLSADSEWERREVGIRPGRVVSWMDWDTRVRRVGYTGQNFQIFDVGAFDDLGGVVVGFSCSHYNFWDLRSSDCDLDITELVSRYTIVPAPDPLPTWGTGEVDNRTIEGYYMD